jgi:shikimate kinase
MIIFLIGYMGSGKTTLGKQLAAKLNYSFIDQDEVIEDIYGMTISDIFAKFGETHFRKTENQTLRDFAENENVVISTGGGAPCFLDNMEIINSIGESVYLNIKPEVLVNRLKHAKNKRPLLKDKSDDELLDFITQKLVERNPFYTKAKHNITGDNIKVDDLLSILPNNQ